ncbi:MAG: hypothetical protein J6S85_14240 [Methanobrevibacter sp.]|nr:hypothetical protein [Methanobrevibacter sp.]
MDKKHPIEIIEMLRDYLQMQDDNCMYNIPYIIKIADDYLKDYHCCAFCDNMGEHDNCPNLPCNSRSFYTDYHCGHYIDRRTGHNPDYYTEEEYQEFRKQGDN